MGARNVSIACCDLRSAFNTGSIFRTADAAGADKIYLCGYTPFPPHDKLKKTSRGTDEHVLWEHRESALELVREKQQEGVFVIAVETGENTSVYTEFDYPENVLLLVGNEALGLPSELVSAADAAVSIPMKGNVNSLNVAVAAALVVYEVLRDT